MSLNRKHKNLQEMMDVLNVKRLTTERASGKSQEEFFHSLIEICSNVNCDKNCPCRNTSVAEFEKVAELEDEVLELKERINKYERNKRSAGSVGTIEMNKLGVEKEAIDLRIDKMMETAKEAVQKFVVYTERINRNFLAMATDCKRMEQYYSEILHENEILKLQLKENFERNKLLKNEILDLKGAIRVFCRIRPPIKKDSETAKIKSDYERLQISESTSKPLNFQFDRIFTTDEDQNSVFNEVRPLIQSGLEGYKICIFAYGQTGSGKTFTMEGGGDQKGLIYNSLIEIFDILEKMKSEGWSHEIRINVVEIYNENIRDLLSGSENKPELKMVDDHVVLQNCSEQHINNYTEINNFIKIAAKNRSVGATQANERSSRSHSVLILKISLVNSILKEKRQASYNFIDLAGSERLNSSKAEGDRLRETQNINKSLAALGNVITSIIRKDAHVPYRDSKLTFLLREYLHGNSRILMFVNIAPELNHLNETTCSLRFASKVSECKLGNVQRNFYREI